MKRLDDTSAELKRIYLDAAARGRGLGRRLLEQLEQHARDLGYELLRLDTGDLQPEALGLFRSAGYRADSRLQRQHLGHVLDGEAARVGAGSAPDHAA